MYLYKKLNSNIDVYMLTPIAKKVTEYKKSVLETIHPNRQFITIDKPDLTLLQPKDCELVCPTNNRILTAYYKASDRFGTTYKIEDNPDRRIYLLRPFDESTTFMNIPEDLYDLENLFQYGLGYVDELSEDDLDMLLKLFCLKGPIATLDSEIIEKVSTYGLAPKIKDEIDYKIDMSNEVFKLIRKR